MYTVLNFHWTPNQFSNLTRKEKAFVIACIDKRVEAEREEMNKMKR
nr:MAG TPA: tail assembly chaperone protein [Caudoviricetes sp.]